MLLFRKLGHGYVPLLTPYRTSRASEARRQNANTKKGNKRMTIVQFSDLVLKEKIRTLDQLKLAVHHSTKAKEIGLREFYLGR